MAQEVILASASAVRRRLLVNAGVTHQSVASGIDEGLIKDFCRQNNMSVEDAVRDLSTAKAQIVSLDHPAALVIGADQILECNGDWFDKPVSLVAAGEHLRHLQGRTHNLVSGTVIVENGDVVWQITETVCMTMRPLSPAFIDDYLQSAGERVCNTVGAYFLEGEGAQLFEKIDGDFFTVLGLPLLPLLAYLRQRNVLSS